MQRNLVALAVTIAAVAIWCCAAPNAAEPVTPTEKIQLFGGENLDGWVRYLPDPNADPANTWQVRDGVIACTGQPAGYLRTEKAYRDYRLHVEWRWPANPGNSGVLLHAGLPDRVWPLMIEAQLASQNAGDIWVVDTEFKEHQQRGEGRRTPKLGPHNENPPGQWNSYDITVAGDVIVLAVNGKVMNIASGCSVTSGHICLQSEGAPIEFRNVWVGPLNQ